MSLIRFQCYVCNQELQVAAEKAGRKAKCIQCNTILTIPMAAGEDEMISPAGTGPAPDAYAAGPQPGSTTSWS